MKITMCRYGVPRNRSRVFREPAEMLSGMRLVYVS